MADVVSRFFGHVYAPADRGLAVVTVQRGRIAAIEPAARRPRDASGGSDLLIFPGLIDLQINGAFGQDFSDPLADMARAARALPRFGVTAFLPTIVSSSAERYGPCLANARLAPAPGMAVVLGTHVEGPFLDPIRAGTHDRAVLRDPTWLEAAGWLRSGAVRVVTLAPELPGALALIRALTGRGVVVAMGHSSATWDQARRGAEAGATLGTHLFNAMRPFDHHDPGIVGYLLASDLPVTFIADGIHLAADTLRLIARSKRPSQLILVTDALAGLGLSSSRFTLAGERLVRDGNVARRPDGTLSGSLLPLHLAVRNLAAAGVSVSDAVAAATANPARLIGERSRGLIKVGARADLAILDRDWNVVETLAAGIPAFSQDRR